MDKLRVMVADSHEVVRMGITYILNTVRDFEVVGEAGVCSEVIQKASNSKPDVIIIDANLASGECAVGICRQIKETYPKVKVLMLISPLDEENIFAVISAGVDGLLPIQVKAEELISAVRAVYEGKQLLASSITAKVMHKVRSGYKGIRDKKDVLLNPQEKRILVLIAEGKTNKEIAQILLLSNNTVKNYVSGIFSKMGFSNRAEAAVYAVRNDIISDYFL
jgi:two-component system response regulator DevR